MKQFISVSEPDLRPRLLAEGQACFINSLVHGGYPGSAKPVGLVSRRPSKADTCLSLLQESAKDACQCIGAASYWFKGQQCFGSRLRLFCILLQLEGKVCRKARLTAGREMFKVIRE